MSDETLEHVVPALLTIKRVAVVLDCSTRTVRRRIHDGRLPAVLEGSRTMVRGDELRAYMWSVAPARRSVYLILGAERVKIGYATHPENRLRDMQLGSPVPLTLVRAIPTHAAEKLERKLHERYAAHRLHGEWFAAVPVLADLALYDDDTIAGWAPFDPLEKDMP
jgi:excisionase family DNA binding protein